MLRILWDSARKTWWWLPNLLSTARILASWVPAFLLVAGYEPSWVAVVWFAGIAVTDLVDGYLARTLNLRSTWGAFIDPIGDKLLVAFSLVGIFLAGWGEPHFRLFVAVMIFSFAREIILSVQIKRVQRGVIPLPTMLGKVKTVVQFFMIGTWMLHIPGLWWDLVRLVMLVATLVVTWASWMQYHRLFVANGPLEAKPSESSDSSVK